MTTATERTNRFGRIKKAGLFYHHADTWADFSLSDHVHPRDLFLQCFTAGNRLGRLLNQVVHRAVSG